MSAGLAGGSETVQALEAWLAIPAQVEAAIEGLTEDALDVRRGPENMSARETVHHLVEANLVASTIIIAGLGKTGCVYDWSWLYPDAAWMRRMGYDKAPVGPSIETLKALSAHIAGLIRGLPDGFSREVQLRDAPGAELYTKSVKDLLTQEVEHAREHLEPLMKARRRGRR